MGCDDNLSVFEKNDNNATTAESGVIDSDDNLSLTHNNENYNMTAESGNDYTIVFVHGFIGWGRDEMNTGVGNIYYWGGIVSDLEFVLKNAGYRVLTASMGPFSSNWDRACELYAQLANSRYVDYGKVHAAEHNHDRFKQNRYYRENGDVKFSKENRVHLIGHSMGAPTARLLVQLLEEGSEREMEEKKTGDYDDISPLFDIAKDTTGLVHSITTIAGANNGVSLVPQLGNAVESVFQKILAAISTLMEGSSIDELPYNFDLEQFGLVREDGESYREYREKVENSSIWQSEDFCFHDLHPVKVYEDHKWMKRTHPGTYYFSYSTKQTVSLYFWTPKYQRPGFRMAPYLMPISLLICGYSAELEYGISIDERWWANDGVLNTYSQIYPFLNYEGLEDTHVEGLPENPEKGRWYHIETLNADHEDVVGSGLDFTSRWGQKATLDKFYLELAEMLCGLKK